MYIPLGASLAEPPPAGAPTFLPSLLRLLTTYLTPPSSAGLEKRGMTSNASQNTNITIGIIVAIVLTTFIAGAGYFMYRYRGSIRFTPRRRRHSGKRRTSNSSKSSKSSKSGRSAAGDEPPPPPPPPSAPPGDPPAD